MAPSVMLMILQVASLHQLAHATGNDFRLACFVEEGAMRSTAAIVIWT